MVLHDILDVQYSFTDTRGILNRLICVVHFSNNFNSVFHKKRFMKLIGALAVWHAKKKQQIRYLEDSFVMKKINYISP